jgi:hypothetical protein
VEQIGKYRAADMGSRKEKRNDVTFPVRIWGMDHHGKMFDVEAYTLDITPVGARLGGVACALHRGATIGVQCGKSKGRFRVAWIGSGEKHGQIGLHQLEVGKYIWGQPLSRTMGDSYEEPETDAEKAPK